MCPEDYVETNGAATARRLLSLYVRGFAVYLLGGGLLWALGVEALYQHPTPFYALYEPAFPSIAVPAAALAVFLGVWFLGCRSLVPVGRTPRLRVLLGAGCLVLILAAGYGFSSAVQNSGRGWAEELAEHWLFLRWHLLVGIVMALFLACLAHAVQSLDRFGDPLSRRDLLKFLGAVYAFLVVFSLVTAMIRGGTAGITTAYERQTYEYIGDIGRGRSIRGLFRDYVKMHPYLSMHAKVHPPGPIVILWLLADLGAGRDPLGLSVATVFFGSLAVFPLFAWVRDMLGVRPALTAAMLYSSVPAIVLFTATSADILFMPFTLTTLFLFWRAIHRRSPGYAAAAGLGYGVLSLLSFSLIGVGVFFALAGLWRLRDPAFRSSVFRTAVVMLAVFLAFHLLVRLWSGFDVIACFRICRDQFLVDQAHLDELTPRYPAWSWRLLNPLCWLFFAGAPVSLLFFWRLAKPEPTTRTLFLTFALTLIALNFLYLARGESERSAMYAIPFAVIPAAHKLDELGKHTHSHGPMCVTFCFLAFQCWFIESWLFTYW